MVPLLDRAKVYVCRFPDECLWRFRFESGKDASGAWSGWCAYRKRPGEAYSSLGMMAEIEVFQKLSTYSHQLDVDDMIDLKNFTLHGGLEEFLTANRIDWEGEEKKKADERNTGWTPPAGLFTG